MRPAEFLRLVYSKEGECSRAQVLSVPSTQANKAAVTLPIAGTGLLEEIRRRVDSKYMCIYNGAMEFEWDPKKSQENRKKHGLDFGDAERIFDGETVTFLDDRIDYGEERYVTMGRLEGRLVVIVHALRGESLRIISMRKGNAREEKIYRKRLKEG